MLYSANFKYILLDKLKILFGLLNVKKKRICGIYKK